MLVLEGRNCRRTDENRIQKNIIMERVKVMILRLLLLMRDLMDVPRHHSVPFLVTHESQPPV